MTMKAFESTLAMSTGRTCTSFPTSTPQCKYVVFPSFQGDHTRKHFTASRTSSPPSTPQWKYDVFLSFRGHDIPKRFRASCSSSSPSNRQWKYDVFLSFRGDDTRKRFTDHLYTALESHGIITFKDDPELQKGKPISPELFSAIEESRFALIVLSENYASSTWCLDELLQILEFMEARETVLPIFYNVDPSDVRKQTGSFTQAFIKHEEKFKDDKKKVQRWRYGLTKVANFSGWDSKDWSESKLVKDIVELVWKRLRPTLLSLVDDFVGIDSRLKPIINLCLDARVDDVCFIGIWGMGGIGKTTIARSIYERISDEFEFKIFLADVRNNVEKSGLPHLQKQLLSTLGMEKKDKWDVHDGAAMIRRFLRGKKVLLILDDVNHFDQLEFLAGNQDWFGLRSRVLITTRNEHLLIKHGVEKRFKLEGLDNEEALQLFSKKAFKKDYPEPGYVALSNRVVNYSKGLPLALKVLGSFLFGRGPSAWNSALDKLREVCNSEIFETLKISYDGLDDNEKKILLDIACFFNGEDTDRVRETLDACGFYAHIGMDVLVEKSLLTINSHGKLSMHDLLQEMGREIVRQESPDDPRRRSRLWHKEDINHVLGEITGTETIEGIIVHPDDRGVVHVNAKSFSMMKKLRYLKLYNVNLSNGLAYLPNSLRILEWPNFPLKSLPSSFNPEDLVELHMYDSRLEYLWKGTKNSHNLKILDLSHSLNLVKTPDFRGIPNLESLMLKGCRQLYEVDPSVVVLGRLTLMNLQFCENLMHLPSSVSGLKSLKVLNVSGCSKLEKLPEDFDRVKHLERLDVRFTAISELPPSVGLLKNLKELSCHGCKVKGPSSKPWSIMLFTFLSFMLPKESPNPTGLRLPSLSGLHSLTELALSNCNLLEGAILNDLGCLSSLEILNLSENQFVSLPRSICQLSRLVSLDVSNCYRLQTLPELPSSIYSVKAYNCNSLEISGPDMVKLLANGFKHVEKRSRSMNAEFTGPGCEFVTDRKRKRKITCEFAFPGNQIPDWWFEDEGRLGFSSATVELHPGWFTDHKLMGFAICLLIPRSDQDILHGYLTVNRRMCKLFIFSYVQVESSHLWLCYLPRHEFLDHQWLHMHTELEFSFTFIGTVMKMCGVRVVYEEDPEAFIK